jgi:hypothetical protein
MRYVTNTGEMNQQEKKTEQMEKNQSATDSTGTTLTMQSQMWLKGGSEVPKLGLSTILDITPIAHFLNIQLQQSQLGSHPNWNSYITESRKSVQ